MHPDSSKSAARYKKHKYNRLEAESNGRLYIPAIAQVYSIISEIR